jgi:hypothetical protein
MQVACPQCGAPATALTESRFYRCAHCGSSFVIQGEEGIQEYVCSHQRDDRLAWSALAEYLERNGLEKFPVKGQAVFCVLPFWCLTLSSGGTRLIPAVTPPFPEVTAVTLPGGDLQFPLPGEELQPPEISLSEAQRLVGGHLSKRFLVHLPLYFLPYSYEGVPFQALVSGADRKVYTRSLPSREESVIPRHHLVMVGLYILLLLVEGGVIHDLKWRALAFILTALAAWPLWYIILKREQ